jgi:hypothetical protein
MMLFIQEAHAFPDWWIQRPSYDMDIGQRVEESSTDNKASVGLGLHVIEYEEDEPGYPYWGNDGLGMYIVATSNSRKILDYGASDANYDWHNGDALDYRLFLGDNQGDWINIEGFRTRFFGGVGSAEYEYIWVSSNGVIFFNYSCTDPYYTSNIPSPIAPHSFAAPFWRDLKPNQSGSITYGMAYHQPAQRDCLVISWNDVSDKNGHAQTFQVVLEPARGWTAPGSESYQQSRIWFQYESITLDDQTTVGIEDQQGGKGVSFNYANLGNGKAILFDQLSNYARIGYLKIELAENDVSGYVEICEDLDSWRGENVKLEPDAEPDPNARFWLALAGGAVLLVPGAAGLILGATLWLPEMAGALAGVMKQADVEIVDGQQTSYAKAFGLAPDLNINPVDALFGIQAYWVFTDPNSNNHWLHIRAILSYDEYSYYGTYIGSETITAYLELAIGSGVSPPVPPGGCPWVSVWTGTRYAFDNNLIPAAEHSNGTDVIDHYGLQQSVVRGEGKYSLLISDTDKHSFLDHVQLLTIDHRSDVNVAVSPYGEILTYGSPASPITAISQDGENLTRTLSAIDGQFLEGSRGDYVTLDFGDLDTSSGARLVLRTDPDDCELNPCKESIHVQISNSTGDWSDAASFIPRIHWATDIIDLSSYLPDANGDLRVRLYFTADHQIDYVGLDTTAQARTYQIL